MIILVLILCCSIAVGYLCGNALIDKEKSIKPENFWFEDVPKDTTDYTTMSDTELLNRHKTVEATRKDLMDIQFQAARQGMIGSGNLGITKQISDLIDEESSIELELSKRGLL